LDPGQRAPGPGPGQRAPGPLAGPDLLVMRAKSDAASSVAEGGDGILLAFFPETLNAATSTAVIAFSFIMFFPPHTAFNSYPKQNFPAPCEWHKRARVAQGKALG
jgi:hypothetical protein